MKGLTMKNSSFLPEDYLAQQAERRTNIISLTLFGLVMTLVFAAFLVTNRQWVTVKNQQSDINRQYQEAGLQIQNLTELEKQKQEMIERAELASALVERVPRSILLAELINRMPPRLSLLEFDMKSDKIKTASDVEAAKAAKGGAKDAPAPAPAKAKPSRPKTKEEAEEQVQKVEPPRYRVTIAMTGVAPTDLELSKYMSSLNAYPLLKDVSLEYSEQKEMENRMVRQFKINMALNTDADVRMVDPLIIPRLNRNPMSDELQLNAPTVGKNTVSADDAGSQE